VAEGVVSTNKSCWQHCPCCHLKITIMCMENDVLFCMYLSFRWKYFHGNSCRLFSTHALHTLHVFSHRSITNGTLLSEHYNWSTVSRLPLEGFSWNTIRRTLLACATNIVSLVVIGRKLQFVASFLPVGRGGVGSWSYWSLWSGEGWVLILFETSIWQGLLYLRKRRADTRPNMKLH